MTYFLSQNDKYNKDLFVRTKPKYLFKNYVLLFIFHADKST